MSAREMAKQRATLKDFLYRVNSAQQDAARMELARNMWRMEFAAEAARVRKEKGITLRGMAKNLGCSPAMLSDFEHHRRWSDWMAHEIERLLHT